MTNLFIWSYIIEVCCGGCQALVHFACVVDDRVERLVRYEYFGEGAYGETEQKFRDPLEDKKDRSSG